MATVVVVELLDRVEGMTGGHWNRGEQVGFSPEEAASLIARGVARQLKATPGPPVDKQVKEPPVKK